MKLKWLHKKLSNVYSMAPMVLLILFASYKSTPGANIVNNYTAKDMFTSIFFGSGNMATDVPALQQFNVRNYTTDAKIISQAASEQDKIYNIVNSKHPEYLPSLKSAVASGNHLTIQNSIQLGARYINDAFSSLHPDVSTDMKEALAADFASHVDVKNATPDELNRAINDYISSGASSNVMKAQACVAIVLVLLLAVALILLLVIPFAVDGTEATLAKEMMVDAIVRSGAK